MLKYKFFEKTADGTVYEFYPEGNRRAPGKVLIAGNEGKIIEESKADIGNRYAYHAISGIDRSNREGTVAWY